MPEGIQINYNDGRPVMEITAGLRAPSFCTSFSGRGTGPNAFQIITPLSPGSTVFVVPTKPVFIDEFADNQTWVTVPVFMTTVTRNGDTGVTINGSDPFGYNRTPYDWAGTVFEILPVETYNEGLFVSNSTNFTAISNRASLMTCAYSGTVTVNGAMTLPASGIPFAKWNNPNVSVGFNGSQIIVRDISYSGSDDVTASVTMDIAIFNNTPPVGGDGITMTNGAGQVTFSTLKRPLVYDGTIVLTNNNQYIGNKFIQLCFTGANSRKIGSYDNVRYKGLVMSDGYVRSERNIVAGNFYNQGFTADFNQNISMPLLILPAMY